MTKGTIMLGKGRYVQSMIGLAAEVVIEAMKDLGGEYIILAVPLDEYEAREKEDKRKLCDFCVHTHIPGELCGKRLRRGHRRKSALYCQCEK